MFAISCYYAFFHICGLDDFQYVNVVINLKRFNTCASHHSKPLSERNF